MSSGISKSYLDSEQLQAIERTLSEAGFTKSSSRYAGYAAFLIGEFERGSNENKLAQALQRHHGVTQFELCHGLATRFHQHAIQGLTKIPSPRVE